ncbi:hypothetical protein ASE16_01305 [Leifsonia sp. Root227]|uniref:ROK family protein n=1 Tax=Leifsonia sp. Root227 TaxID=1736496 RepID=UPI0006F6FDC3|nr:ROK family protein [Leifsonia sp. Root227]KRC51743.1 hypothetical protein ASE16_01305 [Leifsonia sp. Root227]
MKELTTRDLRKRNRSRVLRLIVRDGETSRRHLAAALGLSLATVTNVVADLVGEGLVRESGAFPSDGGRPTAMLSANPEGAYFVGASVREDGATAVILDLSLSVIARVDRVAGAFSDPEAMAATVTEAIDEAIRAVDRPAAIYGVGLGMPGLIQVKGDSWSGAADYVMTSNGYGQGLGWATTPTSVSRIYEHADLPTFADNGAKTQAMAESWFGAARELDDVLIALVGRGLGLGIISDGRLLRGSVMGAGEWGHTKISTGGPTCSCGSRGCLGTYIGAGGIARRWREAGGQPADDLSTAVDDLIASASSGDERAAGVLTETIELLGLGLSNIVNLFNPERIVLGGWVGLKLTGFDLAAITGATRQRSLPQLASGFDFVPAALGRDSSAQGAALLALESLIDHPVRRTVTADSDLITVTH